MLHEVNVLMQEHGRAVVEFAKKIKNDDANENVTGLVRDRLIVAKLRNIQIK